MDDTADSQSQPLVRSTSTAKQPIIKNMNQNQKSKHAPVCGHIAKGTSMPGLRKLIKGDVKAVCAISSKISCNEKALVKWICLQCGNIGCGDEFALGGHAEAHYKTPRSDCHNIAVRFQGELDQAWCYMCNFELDINSPFFKDCLNFLRRNIKIKTALSQNVTLSAPIILGPPPPPPVPKIEPPKPFPFTKGKQNQNKISSNNNRWNSGLDWPMGLENLGNTCFMNSALQCLSRTRSLLNKLDLYGAGNVIEILVTSEVSEQPYIQVVNPDVQEGSGESDFVSDECEKFMMDKGQDEIVESSRIKDVEASSSTLLSTDMDSLLDASRAGPSTKSVGDGDKWTKELEQELKKPLRLRLSIPKDSMTSKLRRCFKAITRSTDVNQTTEDNYDRSEFYSRGIGSNYPTVFCPRSVQFAVSRHFRLGQQHDSHELLRTVVDMMKKDQIKAFRLAIMQRYGVKKSEGKNCDPKIAELLKMWDRKLYHKTFVDEIFGGELVTIQECLQCKSVKHSHEEFLDLSLPIRVFQANPNPSKKKGYSFFDDDGDCAVNRSLEECLRAYTEPEFLTGSNVVECENCHRLNLERLAAGASFDEVFPGVKAESLNQQSPRGSGSTNKKSKYSNKNINKKQSKKRQSRHAKIKSKFAQSSDEVITQDNCDGTGTSSLAIIEDHFKGDPATKTLSSGISGSGEEDAKSSKSGSLDDYVVIQATPMINGAEGTKPSGHTDMDLDFDVQDLEPSTITGDDRTELVDNITGAGNGHSDTNLTHGLSSSLKSLSLIENGMDVDGAFRPHHEEDLDEMIIPHNPEEDELMDDLDEPAVDGVGNASDIEDDEGNGMNPLDLGFIEHGKPPCITDFLTVPQVASMNTATSSTVADEGFSEGENSSEEKNSQSLSGSSSRNSISEADNNEASGGPNEVTTKKIPVTKCPCSRQQLISRPPECLTLHLKRFQCTGRGSSKLNDNVDFQYILDLTRFSSEVSEDVSKPGYKSIFDEDGEVIYSLYGIVEHSGSLHFGHYVAYVKVPGKVKENESGDFSMEEDKWFYISDSSVQSSSLKNVLSHEAYILFYERIRGEEKRARWNEYQELRKSNEVSTSLNNEDKNDEWNASSSTISYSFHDKSSTSTAVVHGPQWREGNWDEDVKSNQQVTSSNDNENDKVDAVNSATSFTNDTDSVSSSNTMTLNYPSLVIDREIVSSSTDNTEEITGMDYSASRGNSVISTSSPHPLWDSETVRTGSSMLNDFGSDFMDESTSPVMTVPTMYGAVSSSSDIERDEVSVDGGYSKLEEVD